MQKQADLDHAMDLFGSSSAPQSSEECAELGRTSAQQPLRVTELPGYYTLLPAPIPLHFFAMFSASVAHSNPTGVAEEQTEEELAPLAHCPPTLDCHPSTFSPSEFVRPTKPLPKHVVCDKRKGKQLEKATQGADILNLQER